MELKILILTDRQYPCNESFLHGALERAFTQEGGSILWVFQAGHFALRVKKRRWEYSDCLVIPTVKGRGILGLIIKYTVIFLGIIISIKDIRQFNPNLILVRNDPFMLLVGWLLSKVWRLPLVYQLSFFKEEATLEIAETARGYKKIFFSVKGGIAFLLRRFLIHRTNHILTISDMMKKILIDKGVPEEKLSTMPMGVDLTKDVSPYVNGLLSENGRERIIYIGTLDKERKLEVLIDAYRIVVAKYPNTELIFVGDYSNENSVNNLEEIVEEYKLSQHIIFLGKRPRNEVPSLIRKSDIAVSIIPPVKRYLHSSPTKLMEYLAEACPVVATRGILEQDEIVSQSRGGVLVCFTSIDIAEGIIQMLIDPVGRKKMGKRGQQYIRIHRNYADMAKQLIKVFNKIISKSLVY